MKTLQLVSWLIIESFVCHFSALMHLLMDVTCTSFWSGATWAHWSRTLKIRKDLVKKKVSFERWYLISKLILTRWRLHFTLTCDDSNTYWQEHPSNLSSELKHVIALSLYTMNLCCFQHVAFWVRLSRDCWCCIRTTLCTEIFPWATCCWVETARTIYRRLVISDWFVRLLWYW